MATTSHYPSYSPIQSCWKLTWQQQLTIPPALLFRAAGTDLATTSHSPSYSPIQSCWKLTWQQQYTIPPALLFRATGN